MNGNSSAFKTLKLGSFIIAAGVIGLAGFFRCSRDNPIDPNAHNYVPGTAPEAGFSQGTVTGFIRDSIAVTVDFSDTQALGGKTPGVTKLLFNWTGDSSAAGITDSVTVSGSGSITIHRYFTTPRDTMVYVRAKDNDGMLSSLAGMRLIVDEGKPKVNGRPVVTPPATPPDSVLTGDSLSVTASASDTPSGTITAYIWTILGKDTATLDSVLRYAFPDTAGGMRTIYVRVTDDDGAVSLRDSVTLKVVPRVDSIGPAIVFENPPDNGIVSSPVITVRIRVSDPSGVMSYDVYINGNAASRITGTDFDGEYQLANVPLDTGRNSIPIWARDNSTNHNQSWDTLHVTYQKPDNTSPTIQFSFPDTGDIVYQSPITVAVTVTDQSGVAWVICGSDTMTNPSGNSYTADKALVEGTNSFIITARDTRGNTAIDTLIFTYVIRDKTPPDVTITAPLPGERIAANTVSVSVIATDSSDIASVTVNGQPATLNGGVYMRNLPLVHGRDTIIAVATDASPVGNQARDTVIVFQNAPPHFVPDTSFKDTNLWVDSVALMVVYATDADNDSLNFSFVTLPKKAAAPTITRTGSSATISFTPDSAGPDTFKVRVFESYGAPDTLADTLTVRVVNILPDLIPPTIAFVTPLPGDTVRDTLNPSPVTVMVSVTDPSGVAWVRCNDSAMSNPSGNSYTRNVTLNEGSNALIITAADTKANSGSNTLIFTYRVISDTTPPTLRIASPQPNQKIPTPSVMVIIYAFDTLSPVRSGVASVTVNGILASFNFGHYMATVPLLAHGYDTLRAVATDSSGNQARDSIIVLQNVPPNFVPDVQNKDTTLWLDSMATITVCASDTENDSMSFTFITMPGRSSTVPVIVPIAGGCANITSYTPNGTGLDTFKVRVTDSWGAVDTLKISATVIPKPTTKPYFTISTLPDTTFVDSLYSVQLTAEDPQSLPLTYSLDFTVTPAGVSVGGISGLLTWTPDSTMADTTVTIRAIVTNTIPESDTLEWAVTVVMPNRPPEIISGPLHQYVNEGDLLQFSHSVFEPDGDALLFSFGASPPAGATIDSLTGLVSWAPGYNQAAEYLLVFIAAERYRSPALSDTVTDTITVANVNRPPVLADSGNRTGYEDAQISFYLSASDPDNDQIAYSLAVTPPTGDTIVNGNNYIWTPSAVQGGVYAVTFIATDNGSPALSDSVIDTFRVIDTTKPVFGLHTALDTAYVGIPYSSAVNAVDGDGDRIFYARLSPAALAVNDSLGTVTWTPDTSDAGTTVTVQITAADHYGNLDTMTWNVTVLVPDYPPVLADPGDTTIDEKQTLQFTLSASDANGDTLRFSFGSAVPAGATLDSVTGVFSWKPTYKQAGTYPIIFKVYERDRVPILSDTVADTITVRNVNHPPYFVYPPDGMSYITYERIKLSDTLRALDSNDDVVFYSMIGEPAGALIVGGNLFTWTPTDVQGGQMYPLSFVASDTGNPAMSDTVNVSIRVLDTTKPVFVTNITSDTAYVESPYSLTVLAVDADSDAIAYSKLTGPASLTVEEKYGIISWKPKSGDVSTNVPISVSIIARDHAGNADTFYLSLYVFPRWPRTYRIPVTGDTGFSVIQTTDGNYAVCGTVGDSAFFMKTDTSGNRLIFKTYGAAGRRWSANCIRQRTNDGAFMLCGTDSTVLAGTSKLLCIRLSPIGDTVWTGRYSPLLSQFPSSTGASVVVLSTGSFVACGTAINRSGSGLATELYMIEVDGAGRRTWEKLYYTGATAPTAGSAGYCIQQTADNGYIVSGEINSGGGNTGTGIYLVKTLDKGDSVWAKIFRYSSGTGARSVGASVAEALDGSSYFVCGYTYNTLVTGNSALIVKTTLAGDTVPGWRWAQANTIGTGVRATADGGCIASAYRLSGSLGGNDATLVKLTSSGGLGWPLIDYGTANNDRAYDVAATKPDGGYIFTGFSRVAGSTSLDDDIYLVKTDNRGAVVK